MEYPFRKANWGMSKSEVRSSESLPIDHEEDRVIGYVGKVMSFTTLIVYIFIEDKLVRTKYGILDRHSNDNLFINDYDNLKESLKSKYGIPISDDHYWHSDTFVDDRESWGLAVSAGHLSYYTQWETKDTKICLSLRGDNFEIELVIEYTSKEFEALEEEYNNKQSLDDL